MDLSWYALTSPLQVKTL